MALDSIIKKPFYIGNFVFIGAGLVLSIVCGILEKSDIAGITWALMVLAVMFLAFVGWTMVTDKTSKYRHVILCLDVFLLSQLFGNINFYISSNVAALQAMSSGLIVVFIGLIFWIFVFGSSSEYVEWGITQSSIVGGGIHEMSNASGISSLVRKETGARTFSIPAVLRSVALYSYEASEDDPTEMSFVKGEVLDILDCNGKWWQARRADGAIGIVPSNYFKILDE
ncbi:hypothetical protein BB559_002331 [Furculomyces boomerangus]|uniref:SH3 domain-containing protein n=2 Tax=Harpellales TaxID=61421 RepID=A0A2T9XYZ0_9FUNG|nr:hypothetical protein BB559_007097 [Furculomyces boomerangus]PVU96623.1 hypothetical protein BB559_002331 [Furculomyces boomerangus]PWA03658.1 hypothetical protein BB558_000151 [Smittium angustum]